MELKSLENFKQILFNSIKCPNYDASINLFINKSLFLHKKKQKFVKASLFNILMAHYDRFEGFLRP